VMTGSAKVRQVWRLLRSRQAGLCYDVDEPGSFARALGALISDRPGVERFRRNALGFVRSEYSWERYEHVLLALVEPR
jgi:glycosyltransferase involved in cell wall biosynthesis